MIRSRDIPPDLMALPVSSTTFATFDLPYPPTVNTYWRIFRNRMIISAKGRAYRLRVQSLLIGVQPVLGRLAVTIDAYMPDKRRRDCDNLPKAVLDSCVHGGLFEDDSQIDDLRIIRREIVPGGKVVVNVRVIR